MKEHIVNLLLARGPLSIEQISAAVGAPADRALRSWLFDLRASGWVEQVYTGRNAMNGRTYTYRVAPAHAPMPKMRATAYRHAAPSGSIPDQVRRYYAQD